MTPGGKRPVERVSAVVVGALLLAGIIWASFTLPVQAVFILGLAGVLSWLAWLSTSYRYPVQSRRVIATYLLAVAFQLIHMSEEYTGNFPHEFVLLFNSSRDWSERSFLLTAVFFGGALWVSAAAGALYRWRVANYFIWFYALGAGLVNAISHFVFPVLKGGYFPGLYTAGGHLVLSVLLIYFLIKETQRLKAEEAETDAQPPITVGQAAGVTD